MAVEKTLLQTSMLESIAAHPVKDNAFGAIADEIIENAKPKEEEEEEEEDKDDKKKGSGFKMKGFPKHKI